MKTGPTSDLVAAVAAATPSSSAATAPINGPVPCYRPGTLIKTARGDERVEKLKIGDKVMTASGGAAADQMDRPAQLWRALRHGAQGYLAGLHQGRRAR